jgi:HK97 family phage portal protein
MAFVISGGQVASIQQPYTTMSFSRSMRLSEHATFAYEEIWRSQPAVRTVVGFLARNIAQVGIDVFSRDEELGRVKRTDHAFAQLMRVPLPGTKWTRFRLFNTLVHELCIYDDAYLLKVKVEGDIRGLLPVPARMVTQEGGTWYAPETYVITGGAGRLEVDAENMVHLHGYNPSNPRQGSSPMESLRKVLAEEFSASTYREQLWRNGARFAGYIQRPLDAPQWSDTALERFQLGWRAQYSGDTASWSAGGGTPVLEDGMTFVPAGVTPKDAQYVESRKLTREEVAAVYHVPQSAVGLLENLSYSGGADQRQAIYQDCVPPWTTMLQEDLENQILSDLDPGAATGATYIEFNLPEKLRGSFMERAKILSQAVGAPYLTRNEARAMDNRPAVEGGDELIVPLNVVAGGLANPADTAPDNPSNEESNGKALQDFLDRMGRTVKSRMGSARKSGDKPASWVCDRARWAREAATVPGVSSGTVERIVDSVEKAVSQGSLPDDLFQAISYAKGEGQ